MKHVRLSDEVAEKLTQYANVRDITLQAAANELLLNGLSLSGDDDAVLDARCEAALASTTYESDFGRNLDRISENALRLASNFAALEENTDRFRANQDKFNSNVLQFAERAPAGRA